MMSIEFVPRKSAVLSSSSLACLADVASVNVTSSCAHRCLYCYSCGYSSRPTEGTVVVYSNLVEKLKAELPRKRKPPKTVYFCPSSDLFQPIPEVLQTGFEMVEFLLFRGLNVAFVTKGVIPDEFFVLFQKYPKQVQAQIGLISTDKSVLSLFEPNAATPEIRLEQIRKLTEIGIQTRVRLDPIIPGMTDDDETLEQVCRSVAAAGVKSIAASFLFLRPAIKESLQRNIADAEMRQRIFDRFSGSKRLGIHAARSSVTAIPREDRETIFQRLHDIACRKNRITYFRSKISAKQRAAGYCTERKLEMPGRQVPAGVHDRQDGMFDGENNARQSSWDLTTGSRKRRGRRTFFS